MTNNNDKTTSSDFTSDFQPESRKNVVIETLARMLSATSSSDYKELASFFKISTDSIYKVIRTAKIPPAWYFVVSEKTGASLDWLATGKNEAPTDKSNGQVLACDTSQIVMVPMVEARLSAGTGSFETEGNSERSYAFRLDFLRRKGIPTRMVLMRVSGDSMEPEIKDGDVVLIDQGQTSPIPGKLYAVGVEDAVYIKEYNTMPGKMILSSVNTVYAPLEVDTRGDLATGVRIIGRAVWIGRELK